LQRADGRGFELVNSDEARSKVAEAGIWHRVGTGIDQYIFRGPANGSLLCIGAKGHYPAGYAQLQQIVDATPYRGKRVRFTAWAASRQAARINFWLASADPNASWYGHQGRGEPLFFNPGAPHRGWIYDGGNSNGVDWWGSHGWTPMLIEIGPISNQATIISFGFVLNGSGDVWLYNPKFDVLGPDDPYRRRGDVYVIGHDGNSSATRPKTSTN
jgi:hypothetical protein